MKFQINRKDSNGYIITGYETIQENESREDAIADYLAWLDDTGVTEDDLSVIVVDFEGDGMVPLRVLEAPDSGGWGQEEVEGFLMDVAHETGYKPYWTGKSGDDGFGTWREYMVYAPDWDGSESQTIDGIFEKWF